MTDADGPSRRIEREGAGPARMFMAYVVVGLFSLYAIRWFIAGAALLAWVWWTWPAALPHMIIVAKILGIFLAVAAGFALVAAVVGACVHHFVESGLPTVKNHD